MIFLEDIAGDVKTRFETSSFELDKPLHKAKNNEIICWIKRKNI